MPGLSAYHQTYGNPVNYRDPLGLYGYGGGLNRHIGESAGEQWMREHGMGAGYTNPVFQNNRPNPFMSSLNSFVAGLPSGSRTMLQPGADGKFDYYIWQGKAYSSNFGNIAGGLYLQDQGQTTLSKGRAPYYQRSAYRNILLGTSTLASGLGSVLGANEHGFGAVANNLNNRYQHYASRALRWGWLPRPVNFTKALGYGMGSNFTGTIANAAKGLGQKVFYVGAFVSGTQAIHAIAYGEYGTAGKAGLDLAMGAIGTFGGVPGLAISGVYFGVD